MTEAKIKIGDAADGNSAWGQAKSLVAMMLLWVFMGSLGWCGDGCADCTRSGLAETRKAVVGD